MKGLRFIVVVAVLLVATCSLITISPWVKAAGNVTILQHYDFYVPTTTTVNPLNSSQNITVEATYTVMGEVENIGDAPATGIAVTANYYDATNTFINSTETSMLPIVLGTNSDFVLMPGAKVPFYEMMLSKESGAENVDHYNLTVTFQPSNPLPPMLQITVDQVVDHLDPVNPARADALTVNGSITNLGSSTTGNWYVYVIGYDSLGQQIGSDHYENNLLGPGETHSFHVTVQNDYSLSSDPSAKVKDFASYMITAQSDVFNDTLSRNIGQYTSVSDISSAVPEYPSILTALLLLAAATMILMVRKKKQP